MSEVRSVLYTGAFRFPDQDAAAFRVFSVAELFKASGCKVTFAGWEPGPDGVIQYGYRGHDCFPQDEFRTGPVNPVRRLFGFLFRGHKTIRWIWKNRGKYEAVVAYNPPAFFALLLLMIGKLAGLKVVLDSTEWYESDHLPGGAYGLAAFENWVRMKMVYKLFDHVICISAFLERHYHGKSLMRVPPLLPEEISSSPAKPDIQSGVSLVYAGEAGKKDRLAALVASLPVIQRAIRVPIQLHVVGMNWQNLSELLRANDVSPDAHCDYIVCHGRVSRVEVLKIYELSHFSVLFRDVKRYALAGFPTKAMESLANGCPIITNAVGDLSEIAKHGDNAFVVEESQLALQLPDLLSKAMQEGRYVRMAEAARNTAMERFSLDAYKNRFLAFADAVFGPAFKG